MAVPRISLGDLSVSKLIVGGNPFSGFSHQSAAASLEMRHYYTVDRIKATLRHAEQLGINTLVARADNHIIRMLMEYWDEGGQIQWIAQTCSERSSLAGSIGAAVKGGAKGVYIHGGMADWMFANDEWARAIDGVARIRDAGVAAGVGGHVPDLFRSADADGLDVDFYMCAYYDPSPRADDPEHDSQAREHWRPSDRDAMAAVIRNLSKPVLHYKVLAGGNGNPQEAFAFVRRHLRDQDAVVVGFYTKHKPDMMEEDTGMLFTA
jgi:hypothetical protein